MDYVAVVDIGKTNKKLCVFDEQLQLLHEVSASFPALPAAHGLLVEDSAAIWVWYRQQLRTVYAEFPFKAIAVTTHGATYALLDAEGALSHSIVAYESPLDDDQQASLDAAFYAQTASPEQLQNETGTCDLPLLINPAKSLFYLQQLEPDVIQRSQTLLWYPQYWGYLLTGQLANEITYAANHSYCYDLHTLTPSSIAQVLGADALMAGSPKKPGELLGDLSQELQAELGLPAMPVAVGIHDSNAALLPYLLVHRKRDFVLNSTGTWCVAMHRVPAISFRREELGQKVLFNIDALGDLHKVSFLMGGQDYGLYHNLIAGDDAAFDTQRIDACLAHADRAILPGASPSQFPGMSGGASADDQQWSLDDLQAGNAPAWFADPVMAHDYLNISLAIQTKVALQRTDMAEESVVFVEGGFRNNGTYLAVLAALLPQASIALTDLPQATAGGTAILALALAQGRELADYAEQLTIAEQPVATPNLDHLAAYENAYMQRVVVSANA